MEDDCDRSTMGFDEYIRHHIRRQIENDLGARFTAFTQAFLKEHGITMALKSILIDEDNRKMLGSRFDVEPEDFDDVLPLGFHLVAEFGNDETFDVVVKSTYEELFEEGDKLENGFVAIEARNVDSE